jgi:hypothetical protein
LVYTCHCTDCQRLTSSAFSIGLAAAETAFHLSGIEPRPLQRTADSGRVNTRLVCPECGAWVCGMPRDGVVRVRAGTLDDTSWLRPTRHIWTRSKQPWITLPAGDEIFEVQDGRLAAQRRLGRVCEAAMMKMQSRYRREARRERRRRGPIRRGNGPDFWPRRPDPGSCCRAGAAPFDC